MSSIWFGGNDERRPPIVKYPPITFVQPDVAPVECRVGPLRRAGSDVRKITGDNGVAGIAGFENGSGRGECGRFAFRVLMNIQAMYSGWQSQGVHPDLDPALDLQEVNEADQLVLGIEQLD